VHGMTEHTDTTAIITTIISLAQALRLKVVAEGVETEQQAQLLRLLRCDQVQGFLFSPPLPAEKVETLL
jgi:EAL domain-containing protein (putative c-di-GMP-specific phosphodiesterase class I)